MEIQDHALFLWSYATPLEIWAKIINPPQPAAFPTSLKPRDFGESAPSTWAMDCDVTKKTNIFFISPGALFQFSSSIARFGPP